MTSADGTATITTSQPAGAQTFQLVDVQMLDTNQPAAAVREFRLAGKPRSLQFAVAIAGGGMGGVAAAIRIAQSGLSVCLLEETDWIGGQMTAQGVSALDENYLVETCGAPKVYQLLRQKIRQHYRQLAAGTTGAGGTSAPDSTPADAAPRLNPGDCWVSWLSFEPRVALEKLHELIAELTARPPAIFLRHKVAALNIKRGRIQSALAVDLDSGDFLQVHAKYFLDASELGDLLPLAGVPYTSGAEARAQTGEAHAPLVGNAQNVQDFTYPFVVEFCPGETHLIAKPASFDKFSAAGKFSLLGYRMFQNADRPDGSGHYLPFWTYRRLISQQLFPTTFARDVAMINWDSNDLRGENIIDQDALTQVQRLALGKEVSLGFLYWLQTQAPRDDDGRPGYPELRLRLDVLGSADGLAKFPYIRESRRIRARRTILEQDIAAATISGARARLFQDSLGIGLYPIDIHGPQDVPGAGQPARPFQIPLGALIQTTVRNLIPACKNIGTTHITNGAYRLHPVEWAIGEAAGLLAAYCLQAHTTPAGVLRNRLKLRQLQLQLINAGSPLFWYDDVPTSHTNFAAVQFLSASSIINTAHDNLQFRPDAAIETEEANAIITRLRKHIRGLSERPLTSVGKTRAEFAQAIFDLITNESQLLARF